MSSSPNLNIPLLAESQSSKYVTVNDAIDLLDGAIAGLLVVAMADANVVLTAAQALESMVFKCTGADTADRNLVVPTNTKLYVVENATTGGHNIIVKTASGTGVTIGPSAGFVIVYCDGTNVDPIGTASGGSYYQTAQQAGTSKQQEGKLNFLAPVTLADNSGAGSTDVTVPAMVGDTGSGGAAGLVPAPGAGSAAAGKFLKADGTFAVPSGSGVTAFTGLSDAPASYSGDGGFAVEVNSGATALVFNTKPFDVAVFAPGVGTNSQKLARIALARAVSFPSGAANSQAKASAAATGSTVYTLTKNGTSFATVTFAASATSGTWTQASTTTFAAGDVLEIDGPGTADATLADVGITLSGTRT
jgi:hypothetical protein